MPARLQANDSQRSISLDKPILFVGRHPECDLVINHSRKISRKHCCLAEINGRFMVRDLGSTNGIQINGRRVVGTRELTSGDELMIGDCSYIFYDGHITPSSPDLSVRKAPAPLSPPDSPYPLDDDSEIRYQQSDMSSEIPIMLNESDNDGFEIFPKTNTEYPSRYGQYPSSPAPPRRQRSDSDSHIEFALD